MELSDDDIDRQLLVELFDESYEIMTIRQLERIQRSSTNSDLNKIRVVGYCDQLIPKKHYNDTKN